HGRVIRNDPQMIEPARCSENGLFFDALDDPEPMVRVNDLVADFECHESPCRKRSMEGRNRTGSSHSIAHFAGGYNEKGPKNQHFRELSLSGPRPARTSRLMCK